MKNRLLPLLILFVLGAVLLSSCGSPEYATSWPGMTASNDTIYVADAGSVLSVKASDGTTQWRFPEKIDNAKQFFAAPVVSSDQVLVGDYAGSFYGLDVNTGGQKWTVTNGKGHFIASPLLVGDTIIAPSSDRSVYAWDTSGKQRWVFTSKYAFWAQPVSDGKVVYIPSIDHNIYALNLQNGNKVWSVDLGGAIVNSPVMDSNGKIYAGTLMNELVSVDTSTGKTAWKFKANAEIWSKPVLLDGNLFFGDLAGTVYCVNSENGKQVWKLDLSNPITGTGAVYADGLVFATENGSVVGISAKGEKLFTKTLTGTINGSPVVAGDKIIVATTGVDNLLVAFDFKGNDKWTLPPPK
jgi:outer membrane protein assembly factor BamB